MKANSVQNRCKSNRDIPATFCRQVLAALKKMKVRLQEKYERAFPGRTQLIRQAVAEAEEIAWSTSYPHLFLPAYTEARVTAKIAASETVFAAAA